PAASAARAPPPAAPGPKPAASPAPRPGPAASNAPSPAAAPPAAPAPSAAAVPPRAAARAGLAAPIVRAVAAAAPAIASIPLCLAPQLLPLIADSAAEAFHRGWDGRRIHPSLSGQSSEAP